MAKRDVIWLHHPETGAEYAAIDEKQAAVMRRTGGWEDGRVSVSQRAESSTKDELVARATELGVDGATSMTKAELAKVISEKENG